MRRLDIGVASYGSSQKLKVTLESIQKYSTTDWRCFVFDNPGPDPDTRGLIYDFAEKDQRIVPVMLSENIGYAGAVNQLLKRAETEYIAYCDNDIEIHTEGWDEALCFYLDRFHEIGMIFPNGGAYPINRGSYTEVMWQAGFCWIVTRLAAEDTYDWGPPSVSPFGYFFDDQLGHQEEADFCLRLRMAGYKCAAAPEVRVGHDSVATSSPESIERINRGVVNFVNKWCRYFGGKNLNYHSPNVLRWEDWPPNALYLEEFWKQQPTVTNLNSSPTPVLLNGREYDLIRVPRLGGFYRNRII